MQNILLTGLGQKGKQSPRELDLEVQHLEPLVLLGTSQDLERRVAHVPLFPEHL